MSTSEPQPAEAKPGRRPFQFSLRALFGLTCGTAAFFSLARTLGYVDALVILAAVVVAVGVMEYPRRVHLPTGIVLTLVAGTLLWANLRPTKWQREFYASLPDRLDPVAKGMFYRGWPLSPCLTCLVHGMKFDTGEGDVYAVLMVDGVLGAIALCVARCACEFYLRGRGRSTCDTRQPPSDPRPTGSTSGPRVE